MLYYLARHIPFPNRSLAQAVFLPLLLLSSWPIRTQTNLVPNPGFEELDECNLTFGDANKAMPWQIVDFPIATPDLFHACADSPEFAPPVTRGCGVTFPRTGDGMVGLAQLNVEERIFARLATPLPASTDIYIACSIISRAACEGNYELQCYANTHTLALGSNQAEPDTAILTLDDIFYETENWTTLTTCYRASGQEDHVFLGNYRSLAEQQQDCSYIDDNFNFAYFYVDDVVVAPFDVMPDTIVLCEGDEYPVDLVFFDLLLSWSDGVTGGNRSLSEAGDYTLFGDTGDCLLRDEFTIIVIPDVMSAIPLEICPGGTLSLQTPATAIWPDGSTGRSFTVERPGPYTATLLSTCGEIIWDFVVNEADCDIDYYVPNAFSPNRDGVNDQLEFFFSSAIPFSGRLQIFDRWGNQLFLADDIGSNQPGRWDGRFRNEPLPGGVYLWFYDYQVEGNPERKVITGDVVIIH